MEQFTFVQIPNSHSLGLKTEQFCYRVEKITPEQSSLPLIDHITQTLHYSNDDRCFGLIGTSSDGGF